LHPILEGYWGEKKVPDLSILATGIGAGVIYAAVPTYFLGTGAGGGIMLGASGAIYGILMAFGMSISKSGTHASCFHRYP
jgi:membrane associated rhomboid family serine protease